MAQAFALGPDPDLERLLLEAEAVEQVALVERGRALQGAGRRRVDEPLENCDVEVDVLPDKRNYVAVGDQISRPIAVQGFPDRRQRLAQIGARLFLGAVAPKQFGELLTRLAAGASKREIGDQRPGLPSLRLCRPCRNDPYPRRSLALAF